MYASMQDSDALAAARALARGEPTCDPGTTCVTLLQEQICAEAGLWETAAARRALDQARGDVAHAVSMLRVWAATLPHVASSPVDPAEVSILRRLSSAYPQIPGGQWLGFAPDLVPRQLDWEDRLDDDAPPLASVGGNAPDDLPDDGSGAPSRAGTPRVRDLISGVPVMSPPADGDGDDPASTVLVPPLSRAARLAVLARGETGALVALAALILGRRQEAVLVELTVGSAALRVPHPRTGAACVVAEVPVTEVEVVLDADVDGRPGLATGWAATLGSVERRAIALALLDAAMQADGDLAEPLMLDEQTVVAATDGSSTNGFVEHLRLPHYAGFAAYLALGTKPAAPVPVPSPTGVLQ